MKKILINTYKISKKYQQQQQQLGIEGNVFNLLKNIYQTLWRPLNLRVKY